MENRPKRKLYMDMVATPKRPLSGNAGARSGTGATKPVHITPTEAAAKPEGMTSVKASRPAAHGATTQTGAVRAARVGATKPAATSRDPFKPRPVVDSEVIARQAAKKRPMTDFRAVPQREAAVSAGGATPNCVARAASGASIRTARGVGGASAYSAKAAPVRIARPDDAQPHVIQHTSVHTVSATPEKVEEFEFGVIEELTPDSTSSVLRPVDHSADYLRVESPESSPEPKPEPRKSTFFKKSHPTTSKSPFLSSVSVPKRPLSASMPTGDRAPTPAPTPVPPAPVKRKKKNTPFIVIVILSVLLGVALGALVYFVLPH